MPDTTHPAIVVTAPQGGGLVPPQANSATISQKPRHKLTLADVEAIADLVIRKRLSEGEACYRLGIKAQRWYVWKSRHKRQANYESVCARVRGASISAAMDRIEDCGNGVGMKQPDWRAHAWRLSVIAPERFQLNGGVQSSGGREAQQLSEAALLTLLNLFQRAAREQGQTPSTPQPIVSCGVPAGEVVDITSSTIVEISPKQV